VTSRGDAVIENKKIDDYVGSTESCVNHLASLDFHEDKEGTLNDLHSPEKNLNTHDSSPAISHHLLVPFLFLSDEHYKSYLAQKFFRIVLSILKTILSSYFPNHFNFNHNIRKNKKNHEKKLCL